MKAGGFQKTTLVDYPGRIASIVFTNGCNLRCGYCYNPELAKGTAENTDAEKILELLLKRKKNIDSVVVTGGEPTIWNDLPDFLKKLKTEGFSVKVDTNGTNPEMLERLLNEGLVDYVAMDVKAPFGKYSGICGAKVDVEKIRKSIELVKKAKDYEFRTTVAPGLSEEDLPEIAGQISPAKKWFLQEFMPSQNILDPSINSKQFLKEKELKKIARKTRGIGECKARGYL